MGPNSCWFYKHWLPLKSKLLEIFVVLLLSLCVTMMHNYGAFGTDSSKIFFVYLILFSNLLITLAQLLKTSIVLLTTLLAPRPPRFNVICREGKIRGFKRGKKKAAASDEAGSWCKVKLPPRPTFKTQCTPQKKRGKEGEKTYHCEDNDIAEVTPIRANSEPTYRCETPPEPISPEVAFEIESSEMEASGCLVTLILLVIIVVLAIYLFLLCTQGAENPCGGKTPAKILMLSRCSCPVCAELLKGVPERKLDLPCCPKKINPKPSTC